MNCLVIDDNPMARRALVELIGGVEDLEVFAECDSAQSAFNCLSKTEIDLLFLDVEMPDMTGLELLKSISNPPLVVLITSKKDYAIEAFDLHVADYIVKPVTAPRFMAAVNHARLLFNQRKQAALPVVALPVGGTDSIFVRADSMQTKIPFDDLLFVQAMGDYAQFFLENGKKLTVHTTLRMVEEALPTGRFQRVHRSFIVNVEKIEAIEDGTSLLIRKNSVPVGEQFKSLLQSRLRFL